LAGKTLVVTGANSGIGLEAAKVFAASGAKLVMACRSTRKGDEAREAILALSSSADVDVLALDLAELASIRRFADTLRERFTTLDVLVNTAGVMALPYRRTADGFEMQLGTNHLGHFALTGRLIDLLDASGDGRVVTVSSVVHRIGKVRFDDLQSERSYGKWAAYGQSKLANLLFAYELGRRLTRAKKRIRSVACHPGYAATNLQTAGPTMEGAKWLVAVNELGNRAVAQDAAGGALPTIHAATSPDVENGGFYGPGGLFGMRGRAVKVRSNARSYDEDAAARLWGVSETLTGVRYL
jgi:NAD(P)-dependent dehydrogenase (short-subunit alcohol dehydrogenase family)